MRLRLDVDTWLKAHGLDQFQVAFLTVPYIPALYMEDLVDLARNVGLELLTLPWYIYRSGDSAQWPVSHINTAMAGMGLGLDGVFPPRDGDEEEDPWNENVFSVLFTDEALTAHVSPILFAPHFYGASGIANFSLGLKSSTPEHNETYWEEIRQAIRIALNSYQRGHELGRVIVHGEHAENEIFDGILREEVRKAQWSDEDGKQPVSYRRETVFAASRGAAVFGNWCQRGLGKADWRGCFPNLRPRGPDW
jgi:hypothetical protein